mmetsp:Transcript_9208/g.18032  ORF Transcript_9208/g.18032 Transcript_9208/m.18032 type:complete len:175 (+) Transcript_9208:1035-1559(+)
MDQAIIIITSSSKTHVIAMKPALLTGWITGMALTMDTVMVLLQKCSTMDLDRLCTAEHLRRWACIRRKCEEVQLRSWATTSRNSRMEGIMVVMPETTAVAVVVGVDKVMSPEAWHTSITLLLLTTDVEATTAPDTADTSACAMTCTCVINKATSKSSTGMVAMADTADTEDMEA